MILDFIRGGSPVRVGDRTFLLKRISFATVVRILTLFGEKVIPFTSKTGAKVGDVLDSFTRREIATMLSWVLEPPIIPVIERLVQKDNLVEVVNRLQTENNISRILKSLNIVDTTLKAAMGQGESRSDAVSGVSNFEKVLDRVAMRYGVPPHEVAEWPYEEVLTILDLMVEESERMQTQVQQAQDRSRGIVRMDAGKVPRSILEMAGKGVH